MKTMQKPLILMSLFSSFFYSFGDTPSGKNALKKWGIPYPTVIAHRGASYYAPEETTPAYQLARDLGADYLEADIQRTKDGKLICLHDGNLKRTTNILEVYPDRADKPVSEFTLEELKKLDAGTWFNNAYPDRKRATYAGLKILTLEELLDIAEGGKNKPGVYLETKEPTLFPGIEKDISELLSKRKLLGADKKGRVIMQTFDKNSLPLLHKYMPHVPICFLLWLDDGAMVSTTPNAKPAEGQSLAAFRATLEVDKEEFKKWILFAKKNGASGTGPGSTLTQLGDQSYMDLVKPWMNDFTHKQGLFIHAYTVDDTVDMQKIASAGVDGFFTNRADVLLKFYGRQPHGTYEEILKQLHY